MSGERFHLLLVRHGLTDWNVARRLLGRIDVGLNPDGRAQARAAAEALKSFPIRAVFSSPQARALETAAPIASAHDLEVEIDPGFDEVWLDPAWQGKTVDELRGEPDLERFLSDPTRRSTRIEPLEDVQSRAVAAVERRRAAHPDGTVVVVSHGDPLRAIVAYYAALPLASIRRILVDNGSVSAVRFRSRGPQLTALNWKPTLA
ncbi:MAG TPA: histidine phosphatase family protein [Vicinamibacteria bacterium]|nr:histidine phosphatase family protein [Vicinamibacteria bacterium]